VIVFVVRIGSGESVGLIKPPQYSNDSPPGGEMAGEITIRRMSDNDLREVKNIDRRITGDQRAISWPLEAEVEWAVNRPALSFVAEQDNRIVGFLLGDIRISEYGTGLKGWIDMVGISPDHQRLGVGRQLVESFREECRKNGVKPNVIIRDDDRQLMDFWRSVGFSRGKLINFEA
jgi:ribosomal protein S18 acetylase RimI-like enzyme